ncbi:hypothetical protein BC833DRAFT_639196 [Globomyces pollinis-pini]|nr:hypothetical protein BC833DRAFT_639196 [Globomyces pollinis-pini]
MAKWYRLKWYRLRVNQLTILNTSAAKKIIQIYCNWYEQWETILLPLLKLKDPLVHSPLSDTNPVFHFDAVTPSTWKDVRETSDAVRYGLNVALAVSKPLKAVQLITPYNSQLTALDIQHQQIRNSNAYWINSTWGPGSAVEFSKECTQDKEYLFKICFGCVGTEDLLKSVLHLLTHLPLDGLKLWFVNSVRAVLSQTSIVPRLLQVVSDIGADAAVHLFNNGSCLRKNKSRLFSTSKDPNLSSDNFLKLLR